MGFSQANILAKVDTYVKYSDIDSAILYLNKADNQNGPQFQYRRQFLNLGGHEEELNARDFTLEAHMDKYRNSNIPSFVKAIYQNYYLERLIASDRNDDFTLSIAEQNLGLYSESLQNDSFLLMHLLHNKGNLLYSLGKYKESIRILENALDIAELIDTRDSSMLAIICFNLANPLYSSLEYHRSYELVERSAAELSKLQKPNLDYYQIVYLDLFSTSLDFGYYEKAENYLNKAEKIYLENQSILTKGLQSNQDKREITLLYNRMMLYNYTKDIKGSLGILAEAENRFRNHKGYYFKLRLAAIYNYMGEAYVIDNPRKSFAYYKKAVKVFDSKNDYEYSLMFEFNLGKAYLNSKEYEKAERIAHSIIEKGESIDDFRLPFFYFLLAKANLENGKFDESLKPLHAVVSSMNRGEKEVNLITQKGLNSFIPSENLNDGYLMVGAAQTIEKHIDDTRKSNLVMNSLYNLAISNFTSNFKKEQFTEKSNDEYEKMLDGLISTDNYLGKQSMEFAELIRFSANSSSRTMWERIKFKNQKLSEVDPTLLAREKELRAELTQLKLDSKGADSTKIKAKIFDVELGLEGLEMDKRERYSSFYKYEDFDFDFVKFQENLSKEQKVLKYEFLDSLLYIYEITLDEVAVSSIDSIQNVDLKVQHFVDLVREPSSKLSELHELGSALTMMLIPDDEYKELLIVPDGILNYLPFDILRTEDTYLIDTYTIRYATSLALLANEGEDSPINSSLIVAPSYEDYMLSDQQLAVRGAAYNLDGALAEADAIAEIISADKMARRDARKASFVERAGDYDLLHLSMHSFMNDDDPELSSLVFFDGDDENELFISELYGMNLDAKLAVLSACNTGVGKEKTGEGMVSVNQAFAYAGVPSVVSSLWSAPDKASKEIMTAFYGYLTDGKDKAKALQLAKNHYRSEQKVEALNHPFFWGGFILYGSNQKLEFKGWTLKDKVYFSLFGVLVFVALTYLLKKVLS